MNAPTAPFLCRTLHHNYDEGCDQPTRCQPTRWAEFFSHGFHGFHGLKVDQPTRWAEFFLSQISRMGIES